MFRHEDGQKGNQKTGRKKSCLGQGYTFPKKEQGKRRSVRDFANREKSKERILANRQPPILISWVLISSNLHGGGNYRIGSPSSLDSQAFPPPHGAVSGEPVLASRGLTSAGQDKGSGLMDEVQARQESAMTSKGHGGKSCLRRKNLRG